MLTHDRLRTFFLVQNLDFDSPAAVAYALQLHVADDLIKRGRNVLSTIAVIIHERLLAGSSWHRKMDICVEMLGACKSLKSKPSGVPAASGCD